jgi:hypothetical protein
MSLVDIDKVISCVKSPYLFDYKKHTEGEFDFILKDDSSEWNVRLDFNNGFPYKLPIAKLLDKHLIGTMPHVNRTGTICISEDDTQLVNYNKPVEVVNYTIGEIFWLLKRGSLTIYKDELTDEYEGYFVGSSHRVNSFYSASENTESIYLKVVKATSKNKNKFDSPVLIYGEGQPLPTEYSDLGIASSCKSLKVVHVALSEAILPPSNQAPISLRYVLESLKLLSEKNSKELKKFLSKEKEKRQFFVLLSMPRTTGERSQVLINFRGKDRSHHPLLSCADNWEIDLHFLNRNTNSYLLERGGADQNLISKKVTIIGCGSVGSEVAYMLAKAGVGYLSLVDPDILEVDNIFRHRLGGQFLNYKASSKTGHISSVFKVVALAKSLECDLPSVKVTSRTYDFDTALKHGDLNDSSIIIIAVGDPSLSLQINKKLMENGTKKAIFCWNEAAGIGGHSVLVDLTESCYECLFTDEKGFSMACQLQLLEGGQNISKNLTGCEGVFTPFSYIDSSQTAVLAAQQGIKDMLTPSGSYALSWKGDNEQDLRPTERYLNMPLKERLELKGKEACGVCHCG